MAIQWGSYGYVNSPVRGRVGVDLTLSYPGGSLDPTDTVATVTGKVYFQLEAPYRGDGINGRAEITGDHTQTTEGIDWSTSSGGYTLVLTFTDSVSLTYATQTYDVTARFRGVTSWSFTPSKKATITVPARPYSKPAAPTNLVATRNAIGGDARQNLSWTRNHTSSAPVTNVEIWRSTNGASSIRIATIDGAATTYADTSTQADNRYTYTVRATNNAGASAFSNADSISTTPATPAAPTATKSASGDIVVARPALSAVATGWEIYDATEGLLLATRTAAQANWTHPTPSPTRAWSYRIRAICTDPPLASAMSAVSNVIQLLAAPLAPTDLSPAVADATEPITISWRHNPADGTPQTAYEIFTRATSSDPWVSLSGKVASTTQSRTVAAGTWANGATREVYVRTWGAHANPSPASATHLLALSARPVVGITTPGPTHSSQRLRAQWSYFDAEGTPQIAWRLSLLNSVGQEVYSQAGDGETGEHLLAYELDNGESYTLRVEVLDGAGLWSLPAEQTTSVVYAAPATPTLEATWMSDEGQTALTVTNPAPTGEQRPLDHVRVERLVPGAAPVVVADDLPGDITVVDHIPPTATEVTYRAVAVSDIGSEASATDSVLTQTEWVFINHGPAFAERARVWGNIELGRRRDPNKKLRQYAGRKRPLPVAGRERPETYDLTATLFAPWAEPDLTSSWDEVSEAAYALVACVRDPEGHRLFVTITDNTLSDATEIHRPVSLPMTLVDYQENV